MSLLVGKSVKVMENLFQYFKYLDLNYSALLADYIANEVASCRY